jgi:cytochrome P450
MEGQLLLAMIAQRYELKLVEDHPVVKEVAITLRPHHGMKMQLFARH